MAAAECFPTIGEQVETTEEGTMEIESMCPVCQENGMTRMMLTRIPFFREVIVSSFECLNAECCERNTFVQFGGTFLEAGVEYVLHPQEPADLNRSVLRSEHTTIRIPELELEIPPCVGEITTVEGLLSTAVESLEKEQVVRRVTVPDIAAQLDDFIARLKECLALRMPWTLHLRDPSGNAFLQSPMAPHHDPCLHVTHFQRTEADAQLLGLAVAGVEQEKEPEPEAATSSPAADYNTRRTTGEESQVETGQLKLGYALPELCFACRRPGQVKLAMVTIPHFQDTVLMSFVCEFCGFRSTEVQSGGAVSDHGTVLTLQVREIEDLSRDVLKSRTCVVRIPEVDLELAEGTLGGLFTTVEGLVMQIHRQLQGTTMASFATGDSSTAKSKSLFTEFIARLEPLAKLEQPWTLILDDPVGHSYIQSVTDNVAEDPRLQCATYTRTAEQDEELGVTALRELDRAEQANLITHGKLPPSQAQ